MKAKQQINILIGCVLAFIIIIQGAVFLKMLRIIEKRDEIYVKSVVEQIDKSISSSVKSIESIGSKIAYDKYTQKYLSSYDMSQKVEFAGLVQSLLSVTSDFSNDIINISVKDSQGMINSFYSKGSYSEYKAIRSIDKELKDTNGEIAKFYTMNKDDYFLDYNCFCYIVPVYSMDDYKRHLIGKIYILGNLDNMNRAMATINLSQDTKYMIVHNNKIISSNNLDKINSEYNVDKSYTTKIIEDLDWNIVVDAKQDIYSIDLKNIMYLFVFIGIIYILLLISISALFDRNITKPLSKIIKALSEIGEKNIKERIMVKTNNEMSIIPVTVNNMLEKFEEMTKKIFQTQEQLYEIEISRNISILNSLQSQINPHFLYNTMECIRSIAISKDVTEIVTISTAMAEIFRYSIKGGDVVTVREELEIINKYLKIIKIRFRDRFEVVVNISDDILDKEIIKMILQPIVENAVYHGVEMLKKGGILEIKGYKDGNSIVFAVKDNGIGLTEQKLLELRENIKNDLDTKNIGLKNVDKRIKLHLGVESGIIIDSKLNEGTIVKIVLKDIL